MDKPDDPADLVFLEYRKERDDTTRYRLPLSRVLIVHSEDNYLDVYTDTHMHVVVRSTLKAFYKMTEDAKPDLFIKVRPGDCILNKMVHGYERNSITCHKEYLDKLCEEGKEKVTHLTPSAGGYKELKRCRKL